MERTLVAPTPQIKRSLMGPNREPQEYSRNIVGIYLPGSLHSIIFLLYSWGSLFGVPIKVPLQMRTSSLSQDGLGIHCRGLALQAHLV